MKIEKVARQMNKSIFGDEWRRCLAAHYVDVIRRSDRITQKSLQEVLLRVGFREDDLKELYLRATMHMDHLPQDFQLDAQQLASAPSSPAEPTFTPHPAECACPACVQQVDTLHHDAEGQPLSAEALHERQERLRREEDGHKPPPLDAPVQRSLF